MSARAMMPIVFCASFVPCVKATKPPETSCSRRNSGSSARRVAADQPRDRDHERRGDEDDPGNGRAGTGISTLSSALPSRRRRARGRDGRAEDAADERVARARGQSQVPGDRFHVIAPTRPARTTSSVIAAGVDDPRRDGRGHLERDERAGEVQDRGAQHRGARATARASRRSSRSSSPCRGSRS